MHNKNWSVIFALLFKLLNYLYFYHSVELSFCCRLPFFSISIFSVLIIIESFGTHDWLSWNVNFIGWKRRIIIMRLFKERIMESIAIGRRNIIILSRNPSMPLWWYFITIWTSHWEIVIKFNPSSLVNIFIIFCLRNASKS